MMRAMECAIVCATECATKCAIQHAAEHAMERVMALQHCALLSRTPDLWHHPGLPKTSRARRWPHGGAELGRAEARSGVGAVAALGRGHAAARGCAAPVCGSGMGTGATAEEQPEGPAPPAPAGPRQTGGSRRDRHVLADPALPVPRHQRVETPEPGTKPALGGQPPLSAAHTLPTRTISHHRQQQYHGLETSLHALSPHRDAGRMRPGALPAGERQRGASPLTLMVVSGSWVAAASLSRVTVSGYCPL